MHLLDLLFPKFCLGCGEWGSYVCFSCFSKIHPLPYLKCPACNRASFDGITHPKCKKRFGLDRLINFFPYTGIVQKAIKTIKYRYAYKVTDDLLHFISIPELSKQSIFVPIPLHPSRRRLRGFNQAEIIARVLSKHLGIPVRTDILERIRKTIPQVDMKNRQDRINNMKGVFIVDKEVIPSVQQNTIIIVIDDVYTTGATMQSACEALKRAGVRTVWGLTIAQ
jgi:ComF family protein